MQNELSYDTIEGKVIDDFVILEKISSGCSCVVHLARHLPTNSYSAAKIIDLNKQTKPSFKGIMREISVYMQVSHPNIALLYRVSFVDTMLIFFLEYASSGTLKQYVQRNNGLTEEETRRIFLQLLSAIFHINNNHFLVHRDIKLDNILLDADNNVKLIDFGLSDTFYCRTLRSFVGTPGYTPPELIAGTEYGEKCDVWSLGVVLYSMLTNMLPFSAQTSDYKLLSKEATSLSPLSGISCQLQSLINQMLEPRPPYRLSVSQLVDHAWAKTHISLLKITEPRPVIFYHIKNPNEIKKFVRTPTPIDISITQICQSMNINIDTLEEQINSGNTTDITTTYFVLSRPCFLNPSIIPLPPLEAEPKKRPARTSTKSKSNPTLRKMANKRPSLKPSFIPAMKL